MMESAIPPHLRTTRTRHRRVPDDYQPPYPSYVARHRPAVARVVMAYLGLQYAGEAPPAAQDALDGATAMFAAADGPRHCDRARYVDEAGFTNVISIAYWDDPGAFDAWFAARGRSWSGDDKPDATIGYFTEILRPAVDRFETLFSAADRREGVGLAADGLSDMVQEHAYWGGMRDRIALSQTDALAPVGRPQTSGSGHRRRVVPHENICLIRSGQDWTDTDSSERRMYLEEVEPILRAGMDFLRDEGLACGCFANRYMTVVGTDGRSVEKSFGMSWWRSLADLERWAESHPTHVAIFGAAMKYLSTLGPAARLRLYHEVTVAAAHEQFFEYLHCHPKTGMLRCG